MENGHAHVHAVVENGNLHHFVKKSKKKKKKNAGLHHTCMKVQMDGPTEPVLPPACCQTKVMQRQLHCEKTLF